MPKSETKILDAPSDIKEEKRLNSEFDFLAPEWRSEFNCGRKYTPSYNIAPTDITPVLVSAEHFGDDGSDDGQSRVIVPMMWGMIPFWHKVSQFGGFDEKQFTRFASEWTRGGKIKLILKRIF